MGGRTVNQDHEVSVYMVNAKTMPTMTTFSLKADKDYSLSAKDQRGNPNLEAPKESKPSSTGGFPQRTNQPDILHDSFTLF